MRLQGKIALITGAGSGIGRAAALRFAEEGAALGINDLLAERAEESARLVRAAGGRALALPADVSTETGARAAVEGLLAAYGRLDILVNNAGIILPGRVDTCSAEDFDRLIAVNLRSAFLVSKYAVEAMRRTGGGAIVINASAAALKGFPDRAAYSASKGALVSLARAMALDHLPEGIRVNCVCPGTTDTPALAERMAAEGDPEAARARFVARQPMGRLGTEREIAEAFLFACEDATAFMTGSLVVIDGGATL